MISGAVLMTVRFLGISKDERAEKLKARVTVCEALAVNCSVLASTNDIRAVEANLAAMVQRHHDMTSAAFRDAEGELVFASGNHLKYWHADAGEHSDSSNIVVPIAKGNVEWGHIEVSFTPLDAVTLAGVPIPSWIIVVTCVVAINGLVFSRYLGKMLRHLDPSKAVPSRVRAALNVLNEGLLVLDSKHRVVLANEAFENAVGKEQDSILGRVPDHFGWAEDTQFWKAQDDDGERQSTPITLETDQGAKKFLVHATAIKDESGRKQGALVTFNDVTALEIRRKRLLQTMRTLEKSRNQIKEQNAQLKILATRDPLTNCWNRRSFFEEFHMQWKTALRSDSALSAVMVDIDHFKSVNDNYGHAMGDEVLRKVSATLLDIAEESDYPCRYGGEEFCLLLVGKNLEEAVEVSERLRHAISKLQFPELSVTASLGVSSISLGAGQPEEMLEQADKSLYVAKRGGRNKVVTWDDVPDDIEVDESKVSRTKEGEEPVEPQNEAAASYKVVNSLLSALSYRDPETAAHCMRVADLSFAVAEDLLQPNRLYSLEVGALLHDIGKIGVPDAVLLKPDKLTGEEWTTMELHSRIGTDLVEAALESVDIANVLRYYRCWYEGDPNRPAQLKGEQIPIEARIVCIADAYDAMVTDRVYRKGRSQEEAFQELRAYAGSQFDPQLVERFIQAISNRGDQNSNQTNDRYLAIQLGCVTEQIARAFDDQDFDSIQAHACRLVETSKKYNNPSVHSIASQLVQLCHQEDDINNLLNCVIELLEICKTAQDAQLNSRTEPQNAQVPI